MHPLHCKLIPRFTTHHSIEPQVHRRLNPRCATSSIHLNNPRYATHGGELDLNHPITAGLHFDKWTQAINAGLFVGIYAVDALQINVCCQVLECAVRVESCTQSTSQCTHALMQ